MRKRHNLKLKVPGSIIKFWIAILAGILLFNATSLYSQNQPLINNIISNTEHNYELGQLNVGALVYTDRTYHATAVPDFLNNSAFIQTPNDDKGNKSTSAFSFNLTRDAVVYVAFDPRAKKLPAWLSNWEQTADKIGFNDPKISYLLLYRKVYPAGSISLGGTLASPAVGALNTYIVAAQPILYSLNVSASGNGIVSKNPDQANYESSSDVVLTPVPGPGQQFMGWSGSATGSANPLTVTMNSNKSIVATFAPAVTQYNLTVGTTGNGSVSKTPDQQAYNAGTSVSLTATPASGQQFSGWSGDVTSSENPLPVIMNGDKNITANFAAVPTQYSLGVTINGNGNVLKAPDQATYLNGSSVSLTAIPAPGQQFSGWSGDINSTNNPLLVTMDANKSLAATFIPQPINDSLFFSPGTLSFSVEQNGTTSNQTAILSTNVGTPSVTLTKSDNTSWLVLPAATLGSLSFGIDATSLVPGNYTATVTASANGYANAILHINLNVTEITIAKSIFFTQSSQTAEVEQGGSQSLLEYISTSDNNPVNAHLTAIDGSGNIPAWLSVNGSLLNNINYTTGSEITFNFDATNLSIGTYTAVVTASATGYNNAILDIYLTVKAPSGGTLTNLKVNFQDSLTVTPTGYLRDFGQAFGARTSANQGTGNTYGWLRRDDHTPVDLTKNGRRRTSQSDLLLATFIHMQANNVPGSSVTPIEGIWEAAVTNGNYDVTVSVGDNDYINSTHTLKVEGVNAISGFVPTSTVKFKTATVTVSVSDGFLTLDAIGGNNTKINYVNIQPSTSTRPSVLAVNPENNSQNVSENASVSTNILRLPNGGINNSTITPVNVYLTEEATGVTIPANVNGTGGGDAITLVPTSPLNLGTSYNFHVTEGVKDLSGASFIPYASRFTTGLGSTSEVLNVKFDKIDLPNATGHHSSLTVGPDGKLYALSIDGLIKRFSINSDGTLGTPDSLYSLQDAYGARQQRLAIGLVFDPSSTPNNLVAWITHSTYLFLGGPDWDGKLSRLSGNNLQTVQDVLINLPRSAKDHVTNSVAFGPDGALYFTQGSTSAMGKADKTWSNRSEHLLSGAVLRLDLTKLGSTLPLNVKTPEGGGTYNPYAANAPLTIYASGVRNAYDLVWHSNGNLYTATNGSAAGGNTPASVNGTLRPDGSTYNGPVIPGLTNVQQTQKDFLYRVVQGGYYGHPNPQRGEYVMNGGNPTSLIDPAQVDDYPVGTLPDANWKGYSFDFQNNKSPNGTIEYKSNTFNGALKGKILVVRYSQQDDIITLTPGGANNDIISSIEGNSIEGFSGFIDPLDLTEDVNTGNIYVSEYGADGKIDLLRPKSFTIPTVVAVSPFADAYVRNGSYANSNYGIDTTLNVKGSTQSGYFKTSYLKFSLNNISKVSSAKLRIYGRNGENTSRINLSVYGVNNDTWTETGITFNNAPVASTQQLGHTAVNNIPQYYEVDVTNFVKTQFAGDKIVTLLLKDSTNGNRNLAFNSREKQQNIPQLIISTDSSQSAQGLAAKAAVTTDASNLILLSNFVGNTTENTGLFSMNEVSSYENNIRVPKIYPNPLHNKFSIQFPSKYEGSYTVQIIDLLGRTYEIGKTKLNAGGSVMDINITKLSLKAGIYFLKIRSVTGKSETTKLIIE
jgi:glucose/arabinose dehydrogenase